MKKLLSLLVLVVLSASLLSACSSSSNMVGVIPAAEGNSTIKLTGGAGVSLGGYGGYGGYNGRLSMDTYSMKGVTISKSGKADASFDVPDYEKTADLGGNFYTASTSTTVTVVSLPTDTDPGSGVPYLISTGDGWSGGYGGSDTNLYIGTGTAPSNDPGKIATGLKVNAGVTLTFGLNTDTDNNDGDNNNATDQDTAIVSFNNDADIAGTVTTASLLSSNITITDQRYGLDVTARDMGALFLSANRILIRSGGSINTKGADGAATGERGGDGGAIVLYSAATFGNTVNEGVIDNSGGAGFGTDSNGGNAGVSQTSLYLPPLALSRTFNTPALEIESPATIINKGSLIANGGKGASGGNAAMLKVYSFGGPPFFGDVYNTGTISANGGEGTNGGGGQGSPDLYLSSKFGSSFNSGSILSKGGNGTSNESGCGGNGSSRMTLYGAKWTPVGAVGSVFNSGDIDGSGGSCTTLGPGGAGGNLRIYANGEIRNSGNLTLNGGNGKGGYNGSNGGQLTMRSYVAFDPLTSEYFPVQPMIISGNISANGGTSEGAATGGNGGTISLSQEDESAGGGVVPSVNDGFNVSDIAAEGGIFLVGYASADLSAGNGESRGGDATSNNPAMSIYTHGATVQTFSSAAGGYDTSYLPSGPITNEMDITIRGGNGTGAGSSGGIGGSLDVATENDANVVNTGGISFVNNSGKIDLSGGAGGTGGFGGDAYQLSFYGHDGVKNSGNITLKGGDAAGGYGGWGADNGVSIWSDADVVNTATIDASGGSGATGGGGSGSFNPRIEKPLAKAKANAPGIGPSSGISIGASGSVDTSGSLIADGAAGSSQNGDGGIVLLLRATNWGTIDVSAGSGGGASGLKGMIWINNVLFGQGPV